jgi:hypothetical protein
LTFTIGRRAPFGSTAATSVLSVVHAATKRSFGERSAT